MGGGAKSNQSNAGNTSGTTDPFGKGTGGMSGGFGAEGSFGVGLNPIHGNNTSGFGEANHSKPSGFKDNSGDKSRDESSNFDSRIKPVSLGDTGPLNMSG